MVLCDAAVAELHLEDSAERVVSLSGRTRQGTPFTVLAGTCVVACGGIENARLLLAPRSTSPAGVGNRHDGVGRWFLEHPHVISGVVVAEGGELFRRKDAWDLFLQGDHPVQRRYGLTADVQRRAGLLDVAYLLDPRPATSVLPLSRTGKGDAQALSAVRPVLRMLRQRRWSPGPAQDAGVVLRSAARMASYAVRQRAPLSAASAGRTSRHPLVFTLVGMAKQTPRADSRVRLGRGVDEFGMPVRRAGMPAAGLHWQLTLGDADSLHRSRGPGPVAGRRGPHYVARAARRAGRTRRRVPPHGHDHMGTTRMSVRPEDGVVDADCRVHGLRHLDVAGSSVFPTGGSANPTLTVVALAARLGQRLRRELRSPVAVGAVGGGPEVAVRATVDNTGARTRPCSARAPHARRRCGPPRGAV